MNKLIIAIIIILVIGGIGVAVYFATDIEEHEDDYSVEIEGREMKELTEEQILEVQEFFDLNPNNGKIESYCQENRTYCGYYCTQINPNHEYCENMASQRNFDGGARE